MCNLKNLLPWTSNQPVLLGLKHCRIALNPLLFPEFLLSLRNSRCVIYSAISDVTEMEIIIVVKMKITLSKFSHGDYVWKLSFYWVRPRVTGPIFKKKPQKITQTRIPIIIVMPTPPTTQLSRHSSLSNTIYLIYFSCNISWLTTKPNYNLSIITRSATSLS